MTSTTPGTHRAITVSQMQRGAAYVLTNCAVVSGSSLVYAPTFASAQAPYPFDPTVELLQDEVSGRLKRGTTQSGQTAFYFPNPITRVGHISQTVTPLNLVHAHNYFHFLVESLPSVLWLLERQAIGDGCVIVSGVLHPNMVEALDLLLGPRRMPVLQLNLLHAISCDRLVTAPPAAHAAQLIGGGTTEWRYSRESLQLLRESVMTAGGAATAGSRPKLFVRRVSVVRDVTNASEVEDIVQAAGYEVVAPETLGFLDQVRLFSQASHIMGPTGAWAANLAFAAPDAKINIFFPDTNRIENTIWRTMGSMVGVTVNDVYCPITRLNTRWDIHSDFRIPPELLRELL